MEEKHRCVIDVIIFNIPNKRWTGIQLLYIESNYDRECERCIQTYEMESDHDKHHTKNKDACDQMLWHMW